MNRPKIGLFGKEQPGTKKVHPKECKKCGGNIMGHGFVSGWAYVDLDSMDVDMSAEMELEIEDEDNLRYRCLDCGFEWE
jgi:predicted RNA-binding Zn-ribbon protein involved in translation (DUF1610 family)